MSNSNLPDGVTPSDIDNASPVIDEDYINAKVTEHLSEISGDNTYNWVINNIEDPSFNLAIIIKIMSLPDVTDEQKLRAVNLHIEQAVKSVVLKQLESE